MGNRNRNPDRKGKVAKQQCHLRQSPKEDSDSGGSVCPTPGKGAGLSCSLPQVITYGHWFGVGGTEMVKKDGKGDLGGAETSSSPLATCCLFLVVC